MPEGSIGPPKYAPTNGKTGKSSVSIGDEVAAFVSQIDSLSTSLLLAMKVTATAKEKLSSSMAKFIDKHAVLIEESDSERFFSIESLHAAEYEVLKRQFNNAELTLTLLPMTFIISLVGQFDTFFARLIRALFFLKPELLNAPENSLPFSRLLDLHSIEAAEEFLLEQEIERILRKSHAERFEWIEEKFDVPIKKDLPLLPVFLEVVERRNHFVHHNGLLSGVPPAWRKEHDDAIDELHTHGDVVMVNPAYFDSAYRCIYEMGVKLAHLLWRKFEEQTPEAADKNLLDIAHDLLVKGKYPLAIAILDFVALTVNIYSSDDARRAFVIDRAQAYKWNKQDNISALILAKDDWTKAPDRFQLAVAVLSDNFNLAQKLMERIGPSDEQDVAYTKWPLFREFRHSYEFHHTYEKVFKKRFAIVERISREKENDSQATSLKISLGS